MNLSHSEMQHLVDTMEPHQIKDWVQQDVLEIWKAHQYRGTAELATGVGKTRIGVLATANEFALNPDAVVVVAVPTITLRDQDWPDEFRKWGFEHLIEKITFVCHTSLKDVVVLTGEVDLLIFDEIHNITPMNYTFFETWRVLRVLGLSATLPDPKGYEAERDKLALINQIAPGIYKVSLEEAVFLQLVAPFNVTILEFDLDDRDRYIDGGTKKKPKKVTEWEHYQYLTKMLKRSMFGKNVKFKFVWMQKRMHFLYTLRQKERLAREIWEAFMGMDGAPKRSLIFCGGIEQANRLCGENVYHSKVKDGALKRFQNKEISYLGVVDALNEGKNIVDLDQILVIQINSQERDITQRIGRTVRFRQDHIGRVVVLVARHTVDADWAENAFRNFNPERIKRAYVKVTFTEQEPAV